MNIPIPSIRRTFLLIFAACTAMMVIALIMQHFFEMEPCPLCVSQRIFVVLAGLIAFLAWLQHPEELGKKIYAALGLLSSLTGGGIATRHVWLQNLPEDQVPTCGPGISYMFETLPFWDALSLLFAGDGNCAEVTWRFLGLTIPGWTLVCFIGLSGFFLWQFIRKK